MMIASAVLCVCRLSRLISNDIAMKVLITLSCACAFASSLLDDGAWKGFYFFLSVAVILLFVVAPGQESTTEVSGMGNGTQYSNSSMIQGLDNLTSQSWMQTFAMLLVPTVCTVRIVYCRGFSFFLQDVIRLLSAPAVEYQDLDEMGRM